MLSSSCANLFVNYSFAQLPVCILFHVGLAHQLRFTAACLASRCPPRESEDPTHGLDSFFGVRIPSS